MDSDEGSWTHGAVDALRAGRRPTVPGPDECLTREEALELLAVVVEPAPAEPVSVWRAVAGVVASLIVGGFGWWLLVAQAPAATQPAAEASTAISLQAITAGTGGLLLLLSGLGLLRAVGQPWKLVLGEQPE